MDLDMSHTLEWLTNQTMTAAHEAQTVMRTTLDQLNSVDWQALQEQGIAIGRNGIGLAVDAIDEIQNQLPKWQEKVSYWVHDCVIDLSWGSRPLWAALAVSLMLLWTVLSPNKDKKLKDKKDLTGCMIHSLFDLAKENATEVMRVMDTLCLDPNYSIPGSEMTLFLCACIGGNARLVYCLLQKGADVSSRNAHGDTCLHLAVYATSGTRYPAKRLVELLLKNGAAVNAQNKRGDTPLHIAAMVGDRDMIQLLLLYEADPAISTTDCILPIHIATNAGFMAAAKLLMVQLDCSGWTSADRVGTPPKVRVGLLSPEKAHLVMSSQPKKRPGFS